MAKAIFDRINPARETAQDGSFNHTAKVPVWDQDPIPLPGWTGTDQKLLMLAAKEEKLRAMQDPKRIRRKLEKISKQFPHKTFKECEQCFRHVEACKVVYFGPKK